MEFFEYPKWIFHPETNEGLIVNSAEDEEKQMSDWGYVPSEELPEIKLGEKPADPAKDPAAE